MVLALDTSSNKSSPKPALVWDAKQAHVVSLRLAAGGKSLLAGTAPGAFLVRLDAGQRKPFEPPKKMTEGRAVAVDGDDKKDGANKDVTSAGADKDASDKDAAVSGAKKKKDAPEKDLEGGHGKSRRPVGSRTSVGGFRSG